MEKMSTDERHAYITGVVEGLATARWVRDKPDTTGVDCIYNWYFRTGDKNTKKQIEWFERHPNKRPGILMQVLIKQDCGE